MIGERDKRRFTVELDGVLVVDLQVRRVLFIMRTYGEFKLIPGGLSLHLNGLDRRTKKRCEVVSREHTLQPPPNGITWTKSMDLGRGLGLALEERPMQRTATRLRLTLYPIEYFTAAAAVKP